MNLYLRIDYHLRECLAHVPRALQVDVEHGVVVLLRHLEHVTVARDAGAVDHDVRHSGHFGLDLAGCPHHGFAGSHIDLD